MKHRKKLMRAVENVESSWSDLKASIKEGFKGRKTDDAKFARISIKSIDEILRGFKREFKSNSREITIQESEQNINEIVGRFRKHLDFLRSHGANGLGQDILHFIRGTEEFIQFVKSPDSFDDFEYQWNRHHANAKQITQAMMEDAPDPLPDANQDNPELIPSSTAILQSIAGEDIKSGNMVTMDESGNIHPIHSPSLEKLMKEPIAKKNGSGDVLGDMMNDRSRIERLMNRASEIRHDFQQFNLDINHEILITDGNHPRLIPLGKAEMILKIMDDNQKQLQITLAELFKATK